MRTEHPQDNPPDLASVSIRLLLKSDLPLCRRLVAEAGWNQVDADWLRALALEPQGCFVAEKDSLGVATTTCCHFGEVGWIAMVLVGTNVRGLGIAGKLVEHAVHYLESLGVKHIRLDATAMGQGLYRKLGFEEEYSVVRYAGIPVSNAEAACVRVSPDDPLMHGITTLDQAVTGTDRQSFLAGLAAAGAAPYYCKVTATGAVEGYLGFREGRNAVQLGPAAALTNDSGRQLFEAAAADFRDRSCYIDIPAQNKVAIEWAESNHFTEQRSFIRMCRGEKITDHPERMWASSGPEKG